MFAFANRYRCILVLDEFDAMAKMRDDPHEVGEIKRVVNTLLQNLDSRAGTGLTIAITNHDTRCSTPRSGDALKITSGKDSLVYLLGVEHFKAHEQMEVLYRQPSGGRIEPRHAVVVGAVDPRRDRPC